MYDIQLTADQVNLIYAKLSTQPFNEVAGVIASLQAQVQARDAYNAQAARDREAAARADGEELARLRNADEVGQAAERLASLPESTIG